MCIVFFISALATLGTDLWCMEAEKGTPKLRRTRSEVSPNTVLPRFAEVISEASPNSLRSFAEVTYEASPMLRRTQLRYFAEVISEASPNPAPILRRSHLRSFAEPSSDTSPKSPPKLRLHTTVKGVRHTSPCHIDVRNYAAS